MDTKLYVVLGTLAATLCTAAVLLVRRVDMRYLIGVSSVMAVVAYVLAMLAVSLLLEYRAKKAHQEAAKKTGTPTGTTPTGSPSP